MDETGDGQRIDNFLFKRLKGVPKTHIYQLLRSGQVRLNSKRVDAGRHLQLGDVVRIPPVRTGAKPVPGKKDIKCAPFPFEILFHDEALIVLNKPAGMAVHGGSGVSLGVIEHLRAQHPEWKFLELVHRLDRGTSGVLFLARSRAALIELHRQIRAGQMEKRYLALVKGKWRNPRQAVRLPLHKYVTSTGERRVVVASDDTDEKDAMPAHTVFILKKSWRDFSLLEAELKTGRTHQIRVHLAHLGFPIAGDDKYGDFDLNKRLSKGIPAKGLKRMFLHAAVAEVGHPITGRRLRVDAPLTADLSTFLEQLDLSETNPAG
ncbi:MAG TPA: RluA family pseudouridine synthase [Nitrosospira sp.]|nr:RluA family pseudouridine synthase [Nitrosospira sp.]